MQTYQFTAVLFGGFEVQMNGIVISQTLARAPKAKSLLEYLLYCRRVVPMEELFQIFWPQGKSPKNALKVLIHRLRTALIQGGVPENIACIVQRQGGYQWNPALDTQTDVENFEKCYQEAMSGKAGRELQAERIRLGLGLYRGRFLDGSELWMEAPSAHFYSAYHKMAQQLCTFYKEEGRTRESIELCRAVLRHDELDEMFNYELLTGLLSCGRAGDARAQYERLSERYYEKLGVQLPESLRRLQQEIQNAKDAMEMDIDSIRDSLEEKTPEAGAFVCEYPIFQELYRIEARCLERYGGRIFLGLLRLQAPGHKQIPQPVLETAMKTLMETARASLRKGDILAQFSASQCVLLLPTVTYESGRAVLMRIQERFSRLCSPEKVTVDGKLRPIRPIKEVV